MLLGKMSSQSTRYEVRIRGLLTNPPDLGGIGGPLTPLSTVRKCTHTLRLTLFSRRPLVSSTHCLITCSSSRFLSLAAAPSPPLPCTQTLWPKHTNYLLVTPTTGNTRCSTIEHSPHATCCYLLVPYIIHHVPKQEQGGVTWLRVVVHDSVGTGLVHKWGWRRDHPSPPLTCPGLGTSVSHRTLQRHSRQPPQCQWRFTVWIKRRRRRWRAGGRREAGGAGCDSPTNTALSTLWITVEQLWTALNPRRKKVSTHLHGT